jgi:hypothetical protein
MTYTNLATFLSDVDQTPSATTALKFNTKVKFMRKFYAKDMREVADNTIRYRSIHGEHASRHENHIGKINICSDLAADSFITGENGTLRGTDILESVVNDVPKYSWIHHSANTLYFHDLNKADVHKFDIRLFGDDDIKTLDDEILPNWTAILVFEQNAEIEYHKDETEDYNKMGYALGHPTR